MDRCTCCHQPIHEGLEFCPHCHHPIHLSFDDFSATDDFAFHHSDNALHQQLRGEQQDYRHRQLSTASGKETTPRATDGGAPGIGKDDHFHLPANPPAISHSAALPPGTTMGTVISPPSSLPGIARSAPSLSTTAVVETTPAWSSRTADDPDLPSWLREIHHVSPDMFSTDAVSARTHPSPPVAFSPSTSSSGPVLPSPGSGSGSDIFRTAGPVSGGGTTLSFPAGSKLTTAAPDNRVDPSPVSPGSVAASQPESLFRAEDFFRDVPSGKSTESFPAFVSSPSETDGFRQFLPDIPLSIPETPFSGRGEASPRRTDVPSSAFLSNGFSSSALPSSSTDDRFPTRTAGKTSSAPVGKSPSVVENRTEKVVGEKTPVSPGDMLNALLNITPPVPPDPSPAIAAGHPWPGTPGFDAPAPSTPAASSFFPPPAGDPSGEFPPASVTGPVHSATRNPSFSSSTGGQPADAIQSSVPLSAPSDVTALQRQNAQLQQHIERQEKLIWELRRQLHSRPSFCPSQDSVPGGTFADGTETITTNASPRAAVSLATASTGGTAVGLMERPISSPRFPASLPFSLPAGWLPAFQRRFQPFLSPRVLGGSAMLFAAVLLANSFSTSFEPVRSNTSSPPAVSSSTPGPPRPGSLSSASPSFEPVPSDPSPRYAVSSATSMASPPGEPSPAASPSAYPPGFTPSPPASPAAPSPVPPGYPVYAPPPPAGSGTDRSPQSLPYYPYGQSVPVRP